MTPTQRLEDTAEFATRMLVQIVEMPATAKIPRAEVEELLKITLLKLAGDKK